jgi:hypothetical protein
MIQSIPTTAVRSGDLIHYGNHHGVVQGSFITCKECGFEHEISFRIRTVTVERKP